MRALLTAFVSAYAMAQDPAASSAEALLRGDGAAAVAAAARAEDPALRARLQAAVMPLAKRPTAMLAVATQFADGPEADAALLAGIAAIAAVRDGGRAVPELMGWLDEEGDATEADAYSDLDERTIAPLLIAFGRALDQRRAAGGDATTLAAAQRLLDLCCVSRFGFAPARVRPAAQWPLPERREDLVLRAWPRRAGPAGWAELARLGPPSVQIALPASATTPIAGLRGGDWLVELASVQGPWRALRAVEVSALDVIGLVDEGVVALGVWLGDAPAARASWQLDLDSGPPSRGELTSGTTLLWTSGSPVHELHLQASGAGAWLPLPDVWRGSHDDAIEPWQGHLMLDRPIYRRGDELHGRLVLRRTRYSGAGLEVTAEQEVAAHQAVRLVAFVGSDAEFALAGTTDANGVYAFELTVPFELPLGTAHLAARIAEGTPHTTVATAWARIADFHRPAIVGTVRGPATVRLGDADPEVVLEAHWASGGPAAGVEVSVDCETWQRGSRALVDRVNLVTDADGCAIARFSLLRLQPGDARVQFGLAMPDGDRQILSHEFTVLPRATDEPQPAEPRREPDDALRLTGPGTAVVGDVARFAVAGRPGERALLVIGRGRTARPQQLVLDATGRAVVDVVPLRSDWPRLDVAVATASDNDDVRVPLRLRAAIAPQIKLPTQCRPGDTLRGRVATGMAGTVVTVAVVDERVFAIAADHTPDPDAALRPQVPSTRWLRAASARAMAPAQLLGSMLVEGRVPEATSHGELDRNLVAGAGGPSAAAGGTADLRVDFRATAAFVTIVADADGVADLALPLPDDLTTWRVTIATVAPDGIATYEQRGVAARLPLSAEPMLPRVLRTGDVVTTQIVVDRAADANAADDTTELQVHGEGASLTVTVDATSMPVPAGAATATPMTLRALAPGDATLSLDVRLGDLADRSQRRLHIGADAVTWPRSVAVIGHETVVCPAPGEIDPALGLEVTVLGGSAAAWRVIAQRLEQYPYGCVEQTLAKLLPFFAAVRGAAANGAPAPTADATFTARLRTGMRRLRELQIGRGGGFAFWTHQKVDAGMTALVLHGLAVVREAGCDPARFDLSCNPTMPPFADAIARVTAVPAAATDDDVLAVELAAACLRSVPGDDSARAAVRAVVDAGGPLPPGCLGRLGLALAAAGDAERARSCLRRIAAGERPAALPLHGYPGEDPIAVQALRLELASRLRDDVGTLTGDLLLQCLHGHGSTYATGAALAALALVLPPDADRPFTVEVRAGSTVRTVELGAANGFQTRLRLPYAASCTVTGPVGRQVLVRVLGQRSERAADHAAWSSPLQVARTLCRRRADADPRVLPTRADLEPLNGTEVIAGDVLWLYLRVSSPTAARYVVVDCPLPAGFALAGETRDVERTDDGFAFTIDWLGPKGTERALPLVALLPGKVLWPPTTAAPMYAEGCDGGTAGSVLTVTPRRAATRAAHFVAFAGVVPPAARVAPPTAGDDAVQRRLDAASDVVLSAYAVAAPAARDAAIERAFADYRACAETEPFATFTEVTWLLGKLRERSRTHADRDAPLLARGALLQRSLLLAVVDAFTAAPGDQDDEYVLGLLLEDIAAVRERDERENLLARVLAIATRRGVPLGVRWCADYELPLESPVARTEVLAAVAIATPEVCRSMLAMLPITDLEALPPAYLASLRQPWPDFVVTALLRTPVGQAELLRCCRDPQCVAYQEEQLLTELPDALWRQLPLAAFAAFDVSKQGEGSEVDLLARLAAAAIPTAELQRALAVSAQEAWRLILAQVLHRRGVRTLGDLPRDAAPDAQIWARAIALPDDDPAGAMVFLRDLEATDASFWREPVREFVVPTVVAFGNVGQLAKVAAELTETQCRAAFARLGPIERRELLLTTVDSLCVLPTPETAEDCTPLWSYGERLDQRDDAADALAGSDVGLAFLRERIQADRDRAEADGVLAAYAAALGLDRDTLAAPADAPWLPALRDVARHGIAAARSIESQRLIDHLRGLRGVR